MLSKGSILYQCYIVLALKEKCQKKKFVAFVRCTVNLMMSLNLSPHGLHINFNVHLAKCGHLKAWMDMENKYK